VAHIAAVTIESRRIPMRHFRLFAVAAALVLTGMGARFASTTRGGFEARMHVDVNPMRIMRESRNLPAQRLNDLSLVFE